MTKQDEQDREGEAPRTGWPYPPVPNDDELGIQVEAAPQTDATAEKAEEAAFSPSERRSVRLDALFWAAALLWSGGVLLAASLGYLDSLSFRAFDLGWNLPFGNEAWTLVFLGIGVLVGIEIVVRLLVPAYRRNVLGYVVLMIVALSLGFGRVEAMWPSILIAVGASLLIRSARRRRA
ncbi:MAG: hypothetical protein ACP5HS_02550 [Anaerolineae bacterium]